MSEGLIGAAKNFTNTSLAAKLEGTTLGSALKPFQSKNHDNQGSKN